MPGMNHLHLSFGNDPKKWTAAIHKSTTVPTGPGKVRVKIPMADGTVSLVSMNQLQIVADQFQSQGTSEVAKALSALKEKALRYSNDGLKRNSLGVIRRGNKFKENNLKQSLDEDLEPMPFAQFAKHRKADKKQSSSDASSDIENDPKEALRRLFEEVFPHDRIEDFIELEKYSLHDQIVSVTKGSDDPVKLRNALKVFNALIKGKKPSRRHRKAIEAAMKDLTEKLELLNRMPHRD